MTFRSAFMTFLVIVVLAVLFIAFSYFFHRNFFGVTFGSVSTISGNVSNANVLQNIHSSNYPYQGQTKTRILIVPGHEPDDGGTQFYTPTGMIYERDLVADLGKDLQQFLDTDSAYQVYITRDVQAWNPTFADYFQSDWNDIIAWEEASKKSASALAGLGPKTLPPVEHNTAETDVALRLYGIIKWSNENKIDLMIHLHLNNYPGHSNDVAGKYSGLVIYTPAGQYGNSSTTSAIADAVFKRLSFYNPIDDLPVESSGIIEDPELIAVGANNTSNAASMLIEYDYIYEPQFVNPKVRDLALKDLAYQTYLGLQDFYKGNVAVTATSSYDPSTFYAWTKPVTGPDSDPEDIYAMQASLIMDGDYPPAGKTMNDCPHSGTYVSCTKAAVKAFQEKKSITGEDSGGTRTFGLLNEIYNNH